MRGHGVGLGRWGSLCARQSHSTPFLVRSGSNKRFCCYKNIWRPAEGCALSLPRLQGGSGTRRGQHETQTRAEAGALWPCLPSHIPFHVAISDSPPSPTQAPLCFPPWSPSISSFELISVNFSSEDTAQMPPSVLTACRRDPSVSSICRAESPPWTLLSLQGWHGAQQSMVRSGTEESSQPDFLHSSD